MDLKTYNYELPEELIAQNAVRPRSFSRLLVVRGRKLEHRRFFNITDYLRKGDVIVVNRTKVMRNKLIGKKVTGAYAEIVIMNKTGDKTARARIKCSHIKTGNQLVFGRIRAKVIGQDDDIFHVEFSVDVDRIIDHADLPNPPYIRRKVGKEYQTVYGERKGSLAAPTAGLHFTPGLIDKIKKMGIKFAYVTLHVGYGTFLPIRDEGIKGHKMEPEYYEIDEENAGIINAALEGKSRVFVVGTTTLKAMETSASCGRVQARKEWSSLFIYPGYKFRLKIDGLITNFHLPKSTLILLVSAFYGWENIRNAYSAAVSERYRFFSLGDATLLLK